MKIRKDMIFAVLTTFCMCALMFAVIPIRSGLPYDPWADLDSNGKIDMKDIANVASQFGTAGDSTKNVNVTNPNGYDVQEGRLNISSDMGYVWPMVYCGGYSRLSLLLYSFGASLGVGNNITVYLKEIDWVVPQPNIAVSHEYFSIDTMNITVMDGSFAPEILIPNSFLTETKGPYCSLGIVADTYHAHTSEHWWVSIDYAVYLRNE